jgi:hypothetical protein
MRVLLYGVVLGAGFLLTALTGRLVWATFAALRAAPAAPLDAAVEGAPDGRWLRLTDLSFRCDTRVESRGSTFFLAEGGPSRTPVAVHLLGSVSCPTAPPEGGFLPGRFSRAWLKDTFDVAFSGTDAAGPEVRLFTTTLTPEYQRRALWRLLPLLGLGLLMAFVGGRGLLRTARARTSGPGRSPSMGSR